MTKLHHNSFTKALTKTFSTVNGANTPGRSKQNQSSLRGARILHH